MICMDPRLREGDTKREQTRVTEEELSFPHPFVIPSPSVIPSSQEYSEDNVSEKGLWLDLENESHEDE